MKKVFFIFLINAFLYNHLHAQCPLSIKASNNSPICTQDTLYLTATPVIPGATYIWTGPMGVTATGDSIEVDYTPISLAGVYTVTVTVNGCASVTDSTIVVLIPAVTTPPLAWYTAPACTGKPLYLYASPYTRGVYTWTGPNGFFATVEDPVINNVAFADSGTYSVIVSVDGCPSKPGATTVIVKPTPASPSANNNSPLCENQTLNLIAGNVPGVMYTWTGPNNFISTNQNPVIPNVAYSDQGSYSVTATTIDGCTSSPVTTVVDVKLLAQQPIANNNGPLCVGTTLNLIAGNISNVSYSWTGPNSFTSTNQNPIITNVTLANAGLYSVTATLNGCSGSAGSTTVLINPIPSPPVASNNSPLCIGQTLNLLAGNISGATYSWTGPNGFISTLQNPLISNISPADAGKYYVTVTVNGCTSNMDSTLVFINPITPVPTAGNSGPVCEGSTLNLTASTVPNATYTWSGPNGFTSGLQNPVINNITVTEAGVYSVVSILNGCNSTSSSTTVVVKALPPAPAVSNNGALCVGSTLQLTAGNIPGASYLWTGPNGFSSPLQNPTIPNVSVAQAGTYNVTATVNGCTGAAGTTIVIINPIPSAPVANNNGPLCVGTTLNLSANSISGATYTWSGPNGFLSSNQNPVILNVALSNAGSYLVTVTVNGCTSSPGTTDVVVNPSPPPPVANNNGLLCVGQTLNLTAGTIAGATYNWTGPNGFSSGLQNPTAPNVSLADAGTYNVTATVNGCTGLPGSTIVVIKPVAAIPVITTNSPVCSGSTLTLNTPFIAGISYSWSGPNGFTSISQNPVINNVSLLNAGLYTLTNIGCTSASNTTNVIINLTPPLPAVTNNGPVCIGQTLNLAANSSPGSTYSWTGPNGFVSLIQNPVIPNAALINSGTYFVSATLNGCTSLQGSAVAVINDSAVVNAGNNQTVCGSTNFINLNGTITGGSTTGMWSTNGSGTFSPANTSLNPLYILTNADKTNGSVLLTLTSTNNGPCPASSSSLVVTILGVITVNAGTDQSICASDNSINLTGQFVNATGAIWSTSGNGTFLPSNTSLNPVYIPGAADKLNQRVLLILTTTGNGNCQPVSDTMILTINPGPLVNAGPDKFVLQNATTTLDAVISGVNLQYLWTPNLYLNSNTVSNPVVTGVNDQLYTLTVTDINGCSNQDQVFVKVLMLPNIPNTFTPNNDGINDTWIISNLESYPNCRVQVFNRYGQLVFESIGYTKPWDGTKNGKSLPFGTYYYIIEPGSGVKPVTGYVTLIK